MLKNVNTTLLEPTQFIATGNNELWSQPSGRAFWAMKRSRSALRIRTERPIEKARNRPSNTNRRTVLWDTRSRAAASGIVRFRWPGSVTGADGAGSAGLTFLLPEELARSEAQVGMDEMDCSSGLADGELVRDFISRGCSPCPWVASYDRTASHPAAVLSGKACQSAILGA